MHVEQHLDSPGELRAFAKFLNELAEIRHAEGYGLRRGLCLGGASDCSNTSASQQGGQAVPAEETVVAETKPVTEEKAAAAEEKTTKRPRKEKPTTPAATENTVAIAEPATTTEPAAATTAETTTAPAPDRTHDDIRRIVGELAQAGKRDKAVALIRTYQDKDGKPCNGVAFIQDKDVAEIYGKLDEIKEGGAA